MTTVLGTCHHDCPDSCGWVATVDEASTDNAATGPVVVKLRGNKEHPFSQGELCPKVNRFIDRVYSPDRLLHPLVRTGPKGSGEFREATWDEALELVAKRVSDAIETHGGQTVLPWWSAGTQGLIQEGALHPLFFAKLGSSRRTGSLCGVTASGGIAATYGDPKAAEPSNVQHSDLIILWATNTKLTNRHLWPFIEKARARGAHVITIDPMRTATAEASDEVIQPLPGTDVAVMLAMMHVLIREGLIDQDYVDSYAVGFEELVEHVTDWTPERASAICGIDAQQITDLAIRYGQTNNSFITTLIGGEHHEHGAMLFRTMACLPVLTGAWRHRGGGLSKSTGVWSEAQIDFGAFQRPNLWDGADRRGLNMNHLGRSLTELSDPPVTVLFAWNGNPAVTVPNSDLIREGMLRDDLFTVVHEQFMTDTAALADVIFPACTQLEQLDVVPSWGHMYVGFNNPAIPPVGESVSNTEWFRRLSKAMGFTEPELFTSDSDLIDTALTEGSLHGIDRQALERDGFVRLDVSEDHNPYVEGGFATPSGRAELVSERLGEMGQPRLPTFIAPEESFIGADLSSRDAADYPLTLTTPKHHVRFLNSSYSALPKHGPPEGGPFIELDPVDAHKRGLNEGDNARVFNDRSSLTVPVRISERLRPGLVAVPFGWWAEGYEASNGSTANALTSDTLTDWGGGVSYGDTLVEVAAVND